MLLAVTIPYSSGEKGTPPPISTSAEYSRFISIDRSIAFATPTQEPTPSPTPIPSPAPIVDVQEPTYIQPIPEPVEPPPIEVEPPVASQDIVYDAICGQGYSWNCERALNVTWCESGGRPWANENPPYVGLFQIDRNLHAAKFQGQDPFDPYVNARVAHQI